MTGLTILVVTRILLLMKTIHQVIEILDSKHEGDGFSKTLFVKAYFIVEMIGPAGQFWLLESHLRYVY